MQLFIANDKVNVTGLILAGSADFKTELGQSEMFDQRLQAKILKTVDVSYGGENGFNQAIELSTECLQNVKFIQEKKLISDFFEQVCLWGVALYFPPFLCCRCLGFGYTSCAAIWGDSCRFGRKGAMNSVGCGWAMSSVVCSSRKMGSVRRKEAEGCCECGLVLGRMNMECMRAGGEVACMGTIIMTCSFLGSSVR